MALVFGTTMPSQLFLASTPLHILNSIAIASTMEGTKSYLWLIDQPEIGNNFHHQILLNWSDSPFEAIQISEGRIKGLRNKLRSRQRIFARLKEYISRNNIDRILTGNDRRIEFQFAMHCATKIQSHVIGCYMDEGTFTYVGRTASESIGDKYIDNLVKKLTYGLWWKHPSTIGASDWISQCYIAIPDLAHSELRKKQTINLSKLFRNNKTVESYARHCFQKLNISTAELCNIESVFTLPHQSIIEKSPNYASTINRLLQEYKKDGKKIGVKYHPRNIDVDILKINNDPTVKVLDHRIPFELYLPLLPEKINLLGDISSTLINSSWLKPNAKIISFIQESTPDVKKFRSLFKDLKISVIDI